MASYIYKIQFLVSELLCIFHEVLQRSFPYMLALGILCIPEHLCRPLRLTRILLLQNFAVITSNIFSLSLKGSQSRITISSSSTSAKFTPTHEIFSFYDLSYFPFLNALITSFAYPFMNSYAASCNS